MKKKVFRVQKIHNPEYGRSSYVEFTKYFLANKEDTVRTIVEKRYGAEGWCDYDREEIVYDIKKIKVEIL
jgi:hypothetical protein